MISIKDYANSRGISTQAVYKQLKTHHKQLEDHLIKEKGKRYLDDFAVDFLNKKTSENAVYIMDQELKARLDELEKENRRLLEELNLKSNIIIKMQQERTEIESKTLSLENDANVLKSEKEVLEAENENIKTELNRLKNRSLLERIFNK